MDRSDITEHVAIIMDGNGRWATEKGLPRVAGHRQGVVRVKEIINAARETGVKYITLFAFSAENWVRPAEEIKGLMSLLISFLKAELRQMDKSNIRLKVIGRQDPLPGPVLRE